MAYIDMFLIIEVRHISCFLDDSLYLPAYKLAESFGLTNPPCPSPKPARPGVGHRVLLCEAVAGYQYFSGASKLF